MADVVAAKHPDVKVRFSLEGNEFTNNAVRGEDDGFNRKVEGMKLLLDAGADLRSVALKNQAERLAEQLAPARVGLVHGRMRADDRDTPTALAKPIFDGYVDLSWVKATLEAALKAVPSWRFQPGVIDGQAVTTEDFVATMEEVSGQDLGRDDAEYPGNPSMSLQQVATETCDTFK